MKNQLLLTAQNLPCSQYGRFCVATVLASM